MADEDLVSIIIPTYYRNEFLEDCLEAATSQTYTNIEIIVVDDSGESNASDVVNSFSSVEYIPLDENKGPNAARNTGIKHASGKYIQLLDDDDIIYPNKISAQVEVFERSADIGVVYCGADTGGANNSNPIPAGKGNVLRLALQLAIPACTTSAMLIRRDLIDDIFPLPDTPGADDTYWKIEFAQRAEFDFVDEKLIKKRMPEDRRVESYGAVEGTWEILTKYNHLYEQFEDSVRNTAKSRAMEREARYLIMNHWYSTRAIILFAKSLYTHPEPTKMHYIRFIISLFGRIPYDLSQKLYQKISQ